MIPPESSTFIDCIRYQAKASRLEPGCRRWEVSRKLDQANVFTLAELYDDADALQAHYDSPHFKRWIEKTGDGLDPFQDFGARPGAGLVRRNFATTIP